MKVLIVDQMHESIVEMLTELGLTVSYKPNCSIEEAFEVIKEYEGLVIRSKFPINKVFLDLAVNLKFIARAGAGLDLFDLDEIRNKKIEVFTANEGNKIAVAEHIIGMILNILNNLSKANDEVKEGFWLREENRGEQLSEKTVGIIGYGNNGQATANRLAAFGAKIIAYDINKFGYGYGLIKEGKLNEIFENADILSLHVPLTETTIGWVNASFFDKFSKPIYFFNASRGEIVVQRDLVDKLKSGKVLGAGLDVLENEKLNQLNPSQKSDFDYLKNAKNVILSPHIAGWTHQSYYQINVVLRDKIKRFLELRQGDPQYTS